MSKEEYEIVLGKLVLIKLYLLKRDRDYIDRLIEKLEEDYILKRIHE